MTMAMAISPSTSYTTATTPIFSLSSSPPFKTRIKISGSVLNLSTYSLNLHIPSQTFSSSAFFVKPISSKTLRNPLRVTTTQPTYIYPDPIPEFAESETQKFRGELVKKLSKSKESFGGDLNMVVNVCAEIFSKFLHKEYGGPGTLLVEPFTDMLVALKEKNLPGAPIAARTALLWAQNYLDKDWEVWNAKPLK